MTNSVTITFETNDLSEVKDKVEAFETLYDVEPTIKVSGELYTSKNDYGLFSLYDWMEVRTIRSKYFSAMVDGNLDEEIEPTTDELLTSEYYDREAEATKWKLEA